MSSYCVNYAVLAKEAAKKPLKGDVNLDGSVTIADAVALQKHLLAITPLSEAAAAQADMDDNNRLTAVDLTRLKNMLLFAE